MDSNNYDSIVLEKAVDKNYLIHHLRFIKDEHKCSAEYIASTIKTGRALGYHDGYVTAMGEVIRMIESGQFDYTMTVPAGFLSIFEEDEDDE